MLEFITLLLSRYHAVLKVNAHEAVKYQHTIEQLTLAKAFFHKGKLNATLPLQIAIIGPTQAGKSSLTNVLLETQQAGISPLAGYTVHPEGFCHNIELANCNDLESYFSPFKQVLREQLNKNNFDCYTLTTVEEVSCFMPPAIFWDTPDFDSIDSMNYREGVLKVIALADVVILAVSKEKYADQTVWDTLKLIEPLQQPTVICVNKLTLDAEVIILESLKEKWHECRCDSFPDVMPLFYHPETKLPEIPIGQHALLFELAKKVHREKQARYEQKLVQKYWQEWIRPVKEEHKIYHEWQALVNQSIEHALHNYERDYLTHPHYYETFKQAIANLLLLLEIQSMAKAMQVVRHPFKKLQLWFGKNRTHLAKTSSEIMVLTQLIDHTFIKLAHQLLDKNTMPLWCELREHLHTHHNSSLSQFDSLIKDYHQNFQQNIENAAQGLYKKLEEQPLVLNTLRATRVTADAAVIALTLYTGGIGLHDLAIAPAMLILTHLLTESAIGGYMKKVEVDLKTQQLSAVKTQIFIPLQKSLYEITEHLTTERYFSISPEQLTAIQTTFSEKPHGLRLL